MDYAARRQYQRAIPFYGDVDYTLGELHSLSFVFKPQLRTFSDFRYLDFYLSITDKSPSMPKLMVRRTIYERPSAQ